MSALDLAADMVELAPYAPPPREPERLREMGFRANAWAPDELDRLRELFAAQRPIEAIASELGRGLEGVRERLRALGLRRNLSLPWTEFEDREIAARYGAEPAAAIAQDLGRSTLSVYQRAAKLGVTSEAAPPWSPWEDAQLRAGYAAGVPVPQIAALIGRGRSAVNSRASDLRLRHPATPAGWSEAEAARALELAYTGIPYLDIIEALASEGFPRRSKAGFGPKIRAMGYGRGWGRAWTADEDELVRQAYARGRSLSLLQGDLARTKTSIMGRVRELGLSGSHPRPNGFRQGPDWSIDDLETLKRLYGSMPVRKLAAQLGRGLSAVYCRANHLGLKHGRNRDFSADEDRAILVAWHRGVAFRDLAAAMNRDGAVVHKRAWRLGLDFSDPQRPARASRKSRGGRAPPSLGEILAQDDPGFHLPRVERRKRGSGSKVRQPHQGASA